MDGGRAGGRYPGSVGGRGAGAEALPWGGVEPAAVLILVGVANSGAGPEGLEEGSAGRANRGG